MNFLKRHGKMIFAISLTAIGSLGGFQTPPKFMQNQIASRIMQFILLFVLIMQGGGQMNFVVSFISAVIFFGLVEGIKYLEKKIDENK